MDSGDYNEWTSRMGKASNNWWFRILF
jgi:hypothetical protein